MVEIFKPWKKERTNFIQEKIKDIEKKYGSPPPDDANLEPNDNNKTIFDEIMAGFSGNISKILLIGIGLALLTGAIRNTANRKNEG